MQCFMMLDMVIFKVRAINPVTALYFSAFIFTIPIQLMTYMSFDEGKYI